MKEAPKHLGCRVVDAKLYLRCSDCNRLISPRDYAAGDETSGECAARWKLLAEGLAGTVHAGHALYDSIVSRLIPHYPADSRDLDWDVLPSTLAALARERDEASASLAAEVKRLRAEVATLHEGWQAERDAALRAHDLLIAERQAARPILAAEQVLEGQSRAEVELKRRADEASASLAAKIGEIRDLRVALDELTRVRAAENGEQGGAPDGGWHVASWSPGRRPTWCRQAVVQGHAGTLYVEYDPLRSGKGWQWSFSGPTASSAYQDAKDPRDGMIAANGAVA